MATAFPATTETPSEAVSLANNYAARAMQLLRAERAQHDHAFERMEEKIRVANLTSVAMAPGVLQIHATARETSRSAEDLALVEAWMEAMMKSVIAVEAVLPEVEVLRGSSVDHMKALSSEVQQVCKAMMCGQAPEKAEAKEATTRAVEIQTRAFQHIDEQVRAAKAFCHAMAPGIQAHATVVSSESKTLAELHSQLLDAIVAIEMEVYALRGLLEYQVQVLAVEMKRVQPAMHLVEVSVPDEATKAKDVVEENEGEDETKATDQAELQLLKSVAAVAAVELAIPEPDAEVEAERPKLRNDSHVPACRDDEPELTKVKGHKEEEYDTDDGDFEGGYDSEEPWMGVVPAEEDEQDEDFASAEVPRNVVRSHAFLRDLNATLKRFKPAHPADKVPDVTMAVTLAAGAAGEERSGKSPRVEVVGCVDKDTEVTIAVSLNAGPAVLALGQDEDVSDRPRVESNTLERLWSLLDEFNGTARKLKAKYLAHERKHSTGRSPEPTQSSPTPTTTPTPTTASTSINDYEVTTTTGNSDTRCETSSVKSELLVQTPPLSQIPTERCCETTPVRKHSTGVSTESTQSSSTPSAAATSSNDYDVAIVTGNSGLKGETSNVESKLLVQTPPLSQTKTQTTQKPTLTERRCVLVMSSYANVLPQAIADRRDVLQGLGNLQVPVAELALDPVIHETLFTKYRSESQTTRYPQVFVEDADTGLHASYIDPSQLEFLIQYDGLTDEELDAHAVPLAHRSRHIFRDVVVRSADEVYAAAAADDRKNNNGASRPWVPVTRTVGRRPGQNPLVIPSIPLDASKMQALYSRCGTDTSTSSSPSCDSDDGDVVADTAIKRRCVVITSKAASDSRIVDQLLSLLDAMSVDFTSIDCDDDKHLCQPYLAVSESAVYPQLFVEDAATGLNCQHVKRRDLKAIVLHRFSEAGQLDHHGVPLKHRASHVFKGAMKTHAE